MAGKPQSESKRDVSVSVRLNEKEAAAVDEARGALTRSVFIRALVRRDVMPRRSPEGGAVEQQAGRGRRWRHGEVQADGSTVVEPGDGQ